MLGRRGTIQQRLTNRIASQPMLHRTEGYFQAPGDGTLRESPGVQGDDLTADGKSDFFIAATIPRCRAAVGISQSMALSPKHTTDLKVVSLIP